MNIFFYSKKYDILVIAISITIITTMCTYYFPYIMFNCDLSMIVFSITKLILCNVYKFIVHQVLNTMFTHLIRYQLYYIHLQIITSDNDGTSIIFITSFALSSSPHHLISHCIFLSPNKFNNCTRVWISRQWYFHMKLSPSTHYIDYCRR